MFLHDHQKTLHTLAELCKRESYSIEIINSLTQKQGRSQNLKQMKKMINGCHAGTVNVYKSKYISPYYKIGKIEYDCRSGREFWNVYYTSDAILGTNEMESLYKEVIFFKNIGFFEYGKK